MTVIAVKPDGQRGRPVIRMTMELADVVDSTIEALATDPNVYQRDGHLVHVVRVDECDACITFVAGTPQIRIMAAATLRERLTRVARFQRFDKRSEKWTEALPSEPVVNAILARGAYTKVRPLIGIIESPSIRPDGTLIQVPGYDPPTGYLYVPSGEFPTVPEEPTREEAERALEELEEPFGEFPFAGEDHRASTTAAVLTIVGRPAILGPTPAFVHDANVRGSGKTLKADAVCTIGTGRATAKMNYPADEVELEKVLAAYALRGAPIVNFDNVVGTFGGGPLDRCLTAGDLVELRILGTNEVPAVRWRAVVMATGNNVALTGDTSRTLLSRLESPLENPEERQDFLHPNLLEWVRAERPRLVVAALTILRAWHVAGRPRGGCRTWGSFEAWSSMIPPAIVFAGGADPMQTRPATTGEEDTEKRTLTAIIEGLTRLDSEGRGLTAKTMLDVLYTVDRLRGAAPPDGYDALREAIDALTSTPPGKAPSSHKLGNKLRAFRRRVIGGCLLDCSLDEHTKVSRWRVIRGGAAGTACTAGTNPTSRTQDADSPAGDKNCTRSARSTRGEDFTEAMRDLGVEGGK